MRIDSPNIGWHGLKDRILSIDFHPFSNQFASAGSDQKKFLEEEREGTEGCIKIWEIINDGTPLHPDNHNMRILYGLSEADKNTNVVRYSPNGAYLASGSDDKCITLWQKRQNCLSISRSEKIYRWSSKGRLMGHSEDVLDLRWTQDSRYIVSSGMDKRIFVWLVEKKYHVKVLDEHEKFVQGIAVDLRFQHILSCSNDRSSKVWKCVKTKKSETEFYCKKSLKRFEYNKMEDEENPQQKTGFRIFADQSVPTFFRRPDVSPDGELFLFPAGIWQKSPESRPQYCSLLYRKNFLEKPTFVLPSNGEPALVCKFCPKLFKKKDEKTGMFAQPYYMVFAVATNSAVLIYSTDQPTRPISGMGNYHYASLTDLSWKDASMLAVSSSDGYCSFMVFENNSLGQIYEPTGELANLMKVTEFVPTSTVKPDSHLGQKERVEYRETQNGVKKKRIVPRKVADI